ncbi:PP2C family protein-serine/threonine phosphatase [Rhizobium terrae]|uniref:PP2C family protein-serine/threonine phosphatase n=1 Tax=Rhizobium terrae TaxID=2171756 RepID=UPI000E3CEF1F|nr:PP2C family protein-serine/threonine phosphatase [Rhizobium terrae]
MNLRTRIALFVGVATLLLSLIFVVQVVLSIRVTDQSARRDTRLLIEAMWRSYVTDVTAAQEGIANRIRRDVELLNALSRDEPDVVEARMAEAESGAEGQIVIVFDQALQNFHHIPSLRLPSDFAASLTRMVRVTDTDGFARLNLGGGSQMIYQTKLVPLRFRFGIVGYALVAAPVSRIVARLNQTVDLDARLVPLAEAEQMSEGWLGSRMIDIPLKDGFGDGRTLGYLGVSNDRSEDFLRTRWLQWLLGGLVVVFVGHVLGGLMWMVRGAFRPLDAAIEVIDKLTRGEEAPPLDTDKGTIEIQRLSEAVEALRAAHLDQEALRQLQAELSVASELQQALLPRGPLVLDGVSFYGQMVPSQEVAGDYFDYFTIDENRAGFLIADVCGKGTPAALFMAMSRTIVRSLAMTGQSPGEVLTKANRVLAETNDKNLFVTVFYGVVDRGAGRLSYSNAGHVPPIMKTIDGAVSYLPVTGDLVLGMIPEVVYETVEIPLAPGSLLVCYTDGIPEAFNAGDEQFGDARLMQMVAEKTELRPNILIDEYRRAVISFAAGRPQYDDITLCLCAF